MIFSKSRPVKIVMLGAGGTGGYVAPHIYRLLSTLQRSVRFIIADGDIVEEKNLIRQNFVPADLGRNKAQVIAERYATAFGIEVEYIPEFIEDEQRLKSIVAKEQYSHRFLSNQQFPQGHGVPDIAKDLVILIGAVDNNRSRCLCQGVFSQMDEMIYIDSGNGEYTGQVVCGIRRRGRNYYKPIGTVYPEVLEMTDKFPTELSCAEAAISAPQSIVANIMAATVVVAYLYNILVMGCANVRNVTFSTKTMNCKSSIIRRRKKDA